MSFPIYGEIVEEEEDAESSQGTKQPPKFVEYGEVVEETPSLKEEVRRHTTRTGSRIVESLAGLPGEAKGMGLSLAKKGLENFGAPRAAKALKGFEGPTSESLRDLSTKIFGEKVTPHNEKEKLIDDIVSDAAVLAIPIKGKIPFARSIGTAIAGNVSEKVAKELGIGEKGQAAAKIGTFFLAGLSGKGGVKKYWKQQYKLADEAVPKRALMDSNKIDRQLDVLSRKLRKGGVETPSQKFVEKPIKDLQKLTRGGEMRVEDAVEAKKKINELRSSLFDEVKGRSGQKGARTRLNDIAAFLDEGLAKYGKENPTFMEHYKNANEAYAGFHQSKKVGNWISSAIPGGKKGKASLLLAEVLFKPASLKATLPGFAAFKGGELLTRMFKNPTLRKFYGNLMKDAIDENKAGFLRNLTQLQKGLQKTDPELFDELTRQDKSNKQTNDNN